MIRAHLAAILALGSAVACGRSQGVPDEDLGGLVLMAGLATCGPGHGADLDHHSDPD